MDKDQDELQLDNQDDKDTQGAPSGNQDDDQDQDDLDNDQADNDQDDNDDDQDRKPTRAERRRERFEKFQEARNGFRATDDQRLAQLRRDPYNPLKYDKEAEYDVDDLESDRKSYGDSRYAQGIELQRFYDQQERYYDKVETDSDWVANRYSFLDEESDDFDPELNSDINEAFFEAAGYNDKSKTFGNTGVRYKTFVQRYVRAMEKFAANRGSESSSNLERQRGRTGVRPTSKGGRKPVQLTWKNPGEMTDEELKAHVKAGFGL
jgi:hypothetical protein